MFHTPICSYYFIGSIYSSKNKAIEISSFAIIFDGI